MGGQLEALVEQLRARSIGMLQANGQGVVNGRSCLEGTLLLLVLTCLLSVQAEPTQAWRLSVSMTDPNVDATPRAAAWLHL